MRSQVPTLSCPTHQGARSTHGHQDTGTFSLIPISLANGFEANSDSAFSYRARLKKQQNTSLFGEQNLLRVRGDRLG